MLAAFRCTTVRKTAGRTHKSQTKMRQNNPKMGFRGILYPFRAKMVESRSCSRVWDQNNPQTCPEIGSTPSSYRPWNSLYVGKFFSTQRRMSRGGSRHDAVRGGSRHGTWPKTRKSCRPPNSLVSDLGVPPPPFVHPLSAIRTP